MSERTCGILIQGAGWVVIQRRMILTILALLPHAADSARANRAAERPSPLGVRKLVTVHSSLPPGALP